MAEIHKPTSDEYIKWLKGTILSEIEKSAEKYFEEAKKIMIENLEKRKAEIITGAVLHMVEVMRMHDMGRELNIVITKEDIQKKYER
jgi:hypothetical protein